MAHFKNIEQIFQITDKCILNQSGLCSHKENSRIEHRTGLKVLFCEASRALQAALYRMWAGVMFQWITWKKVKWQSRKIKTQCDFHNANLKFVYLWPRLLDKESICEKF